MACKVHRIRFYNPKPQSINCASYNKVSKVVAVARADASIEIWSLSHAPFLIKFIPGVENGSIEALGWVNDRLLSTGLGGALVEWDLNSLTLRRTVLLTGYAAWCLDVNSAQTVVAVGTEQGYVNLYSVENDDIEYRKLFDRQEGRIICCKFDKTGSILVTGSTNTIRVWNVATGQATTRISTNRRGQESIVWSLGVFSDNTIVSGEGRGRLTFWDITTGDQIESFVTHKKDILSIAVSEAEDKLYCSGVDPVIVQFNKVPNTKDKSKCLWTKHVQINNHEHDVRCLALQGEKLISVGVDGYLTLSSYPPKWSLRVPPLPPARCALAAARRLLLLKYSNHFEVWKLGSHANNEQGEPIFKSVVKTPVIANSPKKKNNDKKDKNKSIESNNYESEEDSENKTDQLKVAEAPLKLVSVQSKGKKQLRCCEISPNGEFIVYSTDTQVRMLKLELEEDVDAQLSLSKLPVSGAGPATHAAFTADSAQCALAAPGRVHLLAVDSGAGAATIQTIQTDTYLKTPTILHLVVSPRCRSGATYLLVADTVGAISVWARKKNKFEHYRTLPTYHCVPSAISIDADKEVVYAVYVDQKVIEYDLVKQSFLNTVAPQLPPEWFSRARPATAVAAHPARDALVFTDDVSIWVLDRSDQKRDDDEPSVKKRLFSLGEGNSALRTIPVKYLAGLHWLGAREAALVQLAPEHILLQLPPVLKGKTSFIPT